MTHYRNVPFLKHTEKLNRLAWAALLRASSLLCCEGWQHISPQADLLDQMDARRLLTYRWGISGEQDRRWHPFQPAPMGIFGEDSTTDVMVLTVA